MSNYPIPLQKMGTVHQYFSWSMKCSENELDAFKDSAAVLDEWQTNDSKMKA